MTKTLKTLNTFILNFFQTNTMEDLEKNWMLPGNQKKLKNIINSCGKKTSNTPKRAKSAYLYFCQDNRDKVKNELGPDAKATEVTKELGKQWNQLKLDKKKNKKLKEYLDLAMKDKERYMTEKNSLITNTAPKRSKSAYLFFCQEYRSKIKEESGPDIKTTDITKELGKRWNELKKSGDISKFNDLAEKDKLRYENEKLELENKSPAPSKKATAKKAPAKKTPAKKATAKKATAKKATAKKATAKKAPTKKVSGYVQFCRENRESFKNENPKANGTAITKKLATAWKKLNKQEQQTYNH